MASFPHFLNIWSALAATAIAIPALLILYFLKLRRREMVVASTLLWKKAIQDLQVNAPFQKLRRNLLLLLQLLLVLSLLLAFSRPVTNYRPPPGKTSVIVLDRSASMAAKDANGRTRLEEAKRRARELVDSMRKDSAAMVIAFDDTAETLQSFTTDQVALRNAIDSVQQTDRQTRLKLAYELADASMAYNPDQLRSSAPQADVYLFSDGRAEDGKDVGLHGKLYFEKVGSDNSPNVGIVALSAKRNYELPTQVQVFARVANFGPEPVDVPVQLSIDGQVVEIGGSRSQSTLLLPARWSPQQKEEWESKNGRTRSESATFELELTDAAVIKVEQMRKEGDVLAADDSAQVIVPPPKQLAVLLVTDGNYFLERAVQNMHLKNPDVLTTANYEEKVPTQYDVILFDRYTPRQLPAAGSFIYFGCVPPSFDPKAPGPRVTIAKDPVGNDVLLHTQYVLDWKREHPILKDVAMQKLYVEDALKLNVSLDAEVLVDGLAGPLVVLTRDGKRTNLVLAFNVLDSNMPLDPMFPMFMHHALEFMAVGTDMGVRQSFQPGATPTIPRAYLQRADARMKKIILNGPGGSRSVPIPESGDFALPPLNQVGVYTTEPPVPQFERIAVNLLSENESNTLPAEKAPGGELEGVIVAEKDRPSRREWWWYIIACFALPLLFVEWWVYTRRVHL